jgi:hypothetical protein
MHLEGGVRVTLIDAYYFPLAVQPEHVGIALACHTDVDLSAPSVVNDNTSIVESNILTVSAANAVIEDGFRILCAICYISRYNADVEESIVRAFSFLAIQLIRPSSSSVATEVPPTPSLRS